MAEGISYRCETCATSILAWDEGDPYILDGGRKRHVYHPAPERDHAVGIDVPHLCLGCSVEFSVDSRAPRADCPACRSSRITPTTELAGKPCPFCNDGVFGPGVFDAVS